MSSAEYSPEERARLLGKYPSMDHDYHTDSAAYDQIAAAVGPETNAFGQVKDYSPQAWWHPAIVAKLEAAREVPTTIPSGTGCGPMGLTTCGLTFPTGSRWKPSTGRTTGWSPPRIVGTT